MFNRKMPNVHKLNTRSYYPIMPQPWDFGEGGKLASWSSPS